MTLSEKHFFCGRILKKKYLKDIDFDILKFVKFFCDEFNKFTKTEKLDFVVVVATFDSRQRAERQKRDLAESPNIEIKGVGEKYLVIITGFDTEDEARMEQEKHLEKFKDCYIARSKNPAVKIFF